MPEQPMKRINGRKTEETVIQFAYNLWQSV